MLPVTAPPPEHKPLFSSAAASGVSGAHTFQSLLPITHSRSEFSAMKSNDEYLVFKYLKITATCCRDFTSNILKSVFQSFFGCGSGNQESVALPVNSQSDFCSTSETTGLESEDDEVDDSQEDINFDYAIKPMCLGSNGGTEADEGQEYFTSASCSELGDSAPNDENVVGDDQKFLSSNYCGITPTGWGSEDDEEEVDSCAKLVDSSKNDENVVGDDQNFLCSNYCGITPTGWGSEDDEKEADQVQEQDGFEHGHDYETMSESYSLGWENEESVLEEVSHETNLSTLCKPTTRFMHHGSFYEAKRDASYCDRWLLVTVQSSAQFSSNLLNRDTMSNDIVEEILSLHFVIWQTDDGYAEGQKVCCFYKLISLPTILVINPITGEKMCACRGLNHPEDLLEDLMRFTDRSPNQQLNAGAQRESANALTHQTDEEASKEDEEASKEDEEEAMEICDVAIEKPIYPSLPEEPTDKKLICKVGICLPCGKRVLRNFLKTDSTKMLWSYCSSLLEEEESRRFCFIVPRSPKLCYEQETTFEEAGLSSALLRLCFEECS